MTHDLLYRIPTVLHFNVSMWRLSNHFTKTKIHTSTAHGRIRSLYAQMYVVSVLCVYVCVDWNTFPTRYEEEEKKNALGKYGNKRCTADCDVYFRSAFAVFIIHIEYFEHLLRFDRIRIRYFFSHRSIFSLICTNSISMIVIAIV